MSDDNKNAFLLYLDYESTFRKLSSIQCQRLIFAFFDYEGRQILPDFSNDLALDLCWSFIQRNLDRDRAKYDKRCETSKENGQKGGRPPKGKKPNKPKITNGFFEKPNKPKETERLFSKPKKPDIERDKDIEIDTDKDIDTDIVIEKDIEKEKNVRNLFLSPMTFNETLKLTLEQYKQAAEKVNKTAWLKVNFRHISKIHKNFKKIITGFYDDYGQTTATATESPKSPTVQLSNADKYTIKAGDGYEEN